MNGLMYAGMSSFMDNMPVFGGGGTMNIIYSVIVGFLVLGLCGGILYFIWRKKRWNLKVDFKIPRNIQEAEDELAEEADLNIDGFVNAERGKGMYDSKNGVVWVKRNWAMPKSSIKPFDIKKYVQGKNILTVIQTGANEYKPVLPRSYLNVEGEDENGNIEESVLLKTNMDNTESRAWKNQFEREAKEAFSIKNFLKEYGAQLTMGIILFFQFVGFAILYTKVT